MIQNGPDKAPREGDPTSPHLKIGERFNPWRKLCGFYAPDLVARERDLTDGQKRLYERGVRWAGRNGFFWHTFPTIAKALGKSVRQTKDDMAALEAKGLMGHTRRRRQSNIYHFLWHAMFEVQSSALQDGVFEVQDSRLEVQDGVVLKVQPTARESSPLESGPLNSVKADLKLIPGDASQKQRTAASPPVMSTEKGPKKRNPRAEPAVPLSPDACFSTASNPAEEWTPRELAEVRRRIVGFWGREPEKGFEVSVMLRARGATAAAVCDLLDRKYANSNCRVGGRWAPKNQNWFLTVIENDFSPGHLPEQPAAPRPEHEAEPAAMSRGIEAMELAHVSRSIVESARCSDCGGYALVRYTDGTIEGCRCRDRCGGDLNRIPTASSIGIGGLQARVSEVISTARSTEVTR